MAFENLAVRRVTLHEVFKRRHDGALVPDEVLKRFRRGSELDAAGKSHSSFAENEIAVVCKAIESCGEWDWCKDKDHEAERETAPYEFRYQSDHYIVRCQGDRDVGGVTVAAGTPCEIQVRTLLQHAHSELTHDTIYKPSVVHTPKMLRAAAKAMALVEATNDYFEELLELIKTNIEPNKEFSSQMTQLYREVVGTEPDPTKAEGLLNDAYLSFAGHADRGRSAIH